MLSTVAIHRHTPAFFLSLFVSFAPVTLPAAPFPLVPDSVSSYSIAPPKLFWHTGSGCAEGPDGAPVGSSSEDVRRIAAFGGPPRVLFSRGHPRPPNLCVQEPILSEIVADANYAYWVERSGLMRFPTTGNPGDSAETVTTKVQAREDQWRIELTQSTEHLFAILPSTRGGTKIWQVRKDDGTANLLATLGGQNQDLQAQGRFLYWIQDGALQRLDVVTQNPPTTLASNISGYFAEGRRLLTVSPRGNGGGAGRLGSLFTDYVFIGRGAEIVRYDNERESLSGAIYESPDPDARIVTLATNDARLFFFERRTTGPVGGLFDDIDQLLFRTPRGGGAAEFLYQHRSLTAGATDVEHLVVSTASTQQGYVELTGEFLFWQEAGSVQRLPTNAGAISSTDLAITDIEVTQAIQDLDNTVFLVAGKKTFARVHVKSFGAPVPGVPARLFRLDAGGEVVGEPLYPVNVSGAYLTIPSDPDRNVVDDSFLFQLPWDWIADGELRLRAELNPWQLPPEPSYHNNRHEIGPLPLRPSSRLDVHFVAFEYAGVSSPRYKEDILQTHSWIRRTFPLASAPAFQGDSSKGLATSAAYVFDDDLDEAMDGAVQTFYFAPLLHVLSRLAELQALYGDDRFFYGLFRAIEGTGQAGGTVACGTTGNSPSQETDKPFTGKIAAHEIGHLLGRDHPRLHGNCYNTHGPDQAFPYDGGFIGPPDGSLAGFGGGAPFFQVPRGVYPRHTWHDLMTYCYTQWISDYTYTHLYSNLAANDSSGSGSGVAGAQGEGTEASDGWLGIFGELHPRDGFAKIRRVTQSDVVRRRPPRDGRTYKLLLLDEEEVVLAAHDFGATPLDDRETEVLHFAQVVPFIQETREIQIIDNTTGDKLTSYPIAAAAPMLTELRAKGATNPQAKAITLRWSAVDPTGEELSFDVLYSHDGGTSFEPLHFGLRETELEVDTSRLGGGDIFFRVTASNDSRTTSRDTKSFALAPKAPTPHILEPADGTRVRWGQLVSFVGEANDLQDRGASQRDLDWSLGGKSIGSGPLLTLDNLPVGSHEILLTATNEIGLSASTDVTVVVGDDLEIPGPTLSVGPAQVAWSVPNNTRELQVARVRIANAGAGALVWSATRDSDWLRLSETQGDAPATLVLSVDPSELPMDAIYADTITVSGAGQQAVVSVRLVIGEPQKRGNAAVRFRRGDGNADGAVDISDATATLDWLFRGNDKPPCVDATDANGTAGTDISDASFLLNFLFLGGAAPAAPFPACGLSGDEEVDCESYDACASVGP